MKFSATWFPLEQEGYLAHACLCNGLTALRRANLGEQKGLFYSAFFELSIGFERMLKLILILDHMDCNDRLLPNSKTIKEFGHKLLCLFDHTKAVAAKRDLVFLDQFEKGSLPIEILEFLDAFAHPDGRYFNINKLTSDNLQSKANPLEQWGNIVSRIMRKYATPQEQARSKMSNKPNAEYADISFSMISDLNNKYLDCVPLQLRAMEVDIAAYYAIYALVSLISALRELIDSLCSYLRKSSATDMPDIPDMQEFFYFAWADKQHLKRKKKWP